jgi:AcrR family transcriptional regulator/DNA-binding MarR family transcriptional regulator
MSRRAKVARVEGGRVRVDGAGRGGGGGAVRGGVVAGGRGGVGEIQRARIVAAMVDVVRERGVARVTVAHVVGRSGVSRRTFYELFEDRDECLMAAFDLALARAAGRVLPAYRRGEGWRERLRGGLGGLLEFLDDEPALGALCVVDMLGAGEAGIARRARVVDALVDAVDEGRGEARAGLKPSRLTAEGVVGAVLAVLHARLARGTGESLFGLLGPLMGVIVLPYLGPAVAGREAARRERKPRPVNHVNGDVLKDLDMRLTYRTVRVLLAIAAQPGASNREVADAAGVVDQGQISKLLARLGHLGLIENIGGEPVKGEPNSWRLTSKGCQLERTIRQSTPAPA